ncbi:hypothetical protein, partial [uncultured Tenacibaculum sp.]|uniref:hypothetical protein n=1 Tax=uncultured Tenacibaculum sp. TaxID=174713 RepID=UPI0026110BEE
GTDDQTIDQFTFNSTSNELTISLEDDGAAPITVDLSSLKSVINVAGINTISGTGTAADPYIITATEVDGSV